MYKPRTPLSVHGHPRDHRRSSAIAMDDAIRAEKRAREACGKEEEAQESELARCRARHLAELSAIREARAAAIQERDAAFALAHGTLRGLQKKLHRGWMRRFARATTEVYPAIRMPTILDIEEEEEFDQPHPVGCNWCLVKVVLPLRVSWRMVGRDPRDLEVDKSSAQIDQQTDYTETPARERLDTRMCTKRKVPEIMVVQAHRRLEDLCVKYAPWMNYVDRARLERATEDLIVKNGDALAAAWLPYCDGENDYSGDWDDDIWASCEREASMAFYVCIPPDKVALHLKPGRSAPDVVGEGVPVVPPEGRDFTTWHRCYRDQCEAEYTLDAYSDSDTED